ncbi:MAG: HDIG domain-containing protein [Desulfovibrio sp.]
MIERQSALALLAEKKTPPSLLQHALASEAIMRALAQHFGENEDLWGLTGLLHDLDYPATVENAARHGLDTAEMLAGQLPDEALTAIRAHNAEMNGAAGPASRFDYALRCGETVTGLISAAALMRPTGMEGMEVKSIKKKMKDKAFAASVCRDNIRQCAEAGLELDAFLALSIEAMCAHAAELGLSK